MNRVAEILHNLHASLKLPRCHTLRNQTLITPGVEESLSSHFKIVSTSNLALITIILLVSSFRLVFLAVALISGSENQKSGTKRWSKISSERVCEHPLSRQERELHVGHFQTTSS